MMQPISWIQLGGNYTMYKQEKILPLRLVLIIKNLLEALGALDKKEQQLGKFHYLHIKESRFLFKYGLLELGK